MSNRQCYALFVGIDKYKSPVPPLDGCVNDMRAMRDYLVRSMNRSGIPLHMEVLENEEATRFNVVAKFEKHLAQAQKDDIVFFYFSGHGSQERTHEIFFPLEADHKNETLVCYDSRMPDGMDLADKEVATLLDVVAQKDPHIVVVYDCCNSGSGTRSLTDLENAGVKVRAFDELPEQVRSLDDYILPRNVDRDRSVFSFDNPDTAIVPKARHIHLAAAQSFQLAKETLLGGSPRGVFTYSLVEVLENSVGPLTYHDLIRRVRSLVTERTFDQNPQLYAAVPEDADSVFLDGVNTREVNYYNLTHDREEGWKIDAGAVHGLMGGGFSQGKTTLNVYPADATDKELANPALALGMVSLKQVLPTHSTVRIEGSLFLAKDSSYRARLHDMAVPQMPIFFNVSSTDATALRRMLEEIPEAQIYLQEVSRPEEADFLVVASRSQAYYITRQTNADALPLVAPVDKRGSNPNKELVDQLIHIARWERMTELQNPGSTLPSESMKLEVLHPDRDEIMTVGQLGLVLRYSTSQSLPQFRLRLVNTSSKRLYGSLLYLSSLFAINPDAVPQGGMWLEPGQSAWAADGNAITGTISPQQEALGRNEVHEIFKLIFSTEEFDGRLLRQPELGQPRPMTRGMKEQTQTRALLFGSGNMANVADWNTNQVSVTVIKESA